jgi:probable phosphoglycerate mutase
MIDGESLAGLAARADLVIATLLRTGGDILVISHGHFLRELATRWIEAAPAQAGRLELWTATISELGWEHENRVIEIWNSAPAGP